MFLGSSSTVSPSVWPDTLEHRLPKALRAKKQNGPKHKIEETLAPPKLPLKDCLLSSGENHLWLYRNPGTLVQTLALGSPTLVVQILPFPSSLCDCRTINTRYSIHTPLEL